MNNLTQAQPRSRPILFQGNMVRGLLAGTKTQTRRVIKGLSEKMWIEEAVNGGFLVCYDGEPSCGTGVWETTEHSHPILCPYGAPGDRLWVREAWARTAVYQASGQELVVYRESDNRTDYGGPWKPSIHMFRRDSRILLEITEVRVERLQDISRGDAMDEGCPFPNMALGGDPRKWYADLWEKINGPGSWDANPWVWAISFKLVKP